MIGKVFLSIFTFILCGVYSLAAYGDEMRPIGRYCGKVYHNGSMVNVEMMLELSPEGKLAGTMRYRDGNVTTQGQLTQIAPPIGGRETLKWADKYGTGYAFLDFTADFSTFIGAWGSFDQRPKQPTNPWIGKRCSGFIS